MKKRVLSLALACLLLAMVPAETVMAMPSVSTPVVGTYELTEVSETEVVEENPIVEEDVVVEEDGEVEVEATEEPTAEPEVTKEPEETPEVEATEEPTAEPEVTEAPEETPVVEVTEEPTAEPEVAETPEVEVTEEPTAEPEVTEEPEETPEVEATTEPTAEPIVELETTKSPMDVIPEGSDLTSKVVGTNGIEYEGVAYLSLQTVNGLPDSAVEEYIEMCDTVATWKEAGVEVSDVVISVEEDRLVFGVSVPSKMLFSEEVQEQFLADDQEKVSSIIEDEEVEVFEEELSDDVVVGEELSDDVVVEEEFDNDVVIEEESGDDENDDEVESSVEEDSVQNIILAETDEIEKDITVTSKNDVVINENELLQKSFEMKEETVLDVSDVEVNELDTLVTNKNHFKNQLSGIEKKIYDKMKSAVTDKGKNKFTYKTTKSGAKEVTKNNGAVERYCNAISAYINTYPTKTEWWDTTEAFRLIEYTYLFVDKVEFECTLPKSPYFTTDLEKQAKAKTKTIVAEAKDYANKNYSQNPIYGMVAYFDKWICDHNKYDTTYGLNPYKNPQQYYYCHSGYGILLEKNGVCESYARAMTRLLDSAGIRNMYVMGYATEPDAGHAWNYVQMPDGKWYLLDSTWNDDTGTKKWLLCANDGAAHTAEGMRYTVGKKFKYTTVATSDYNVNYEKSYVGAITLNKNKVYLKPEAKYQLKLKKPSTDNIYYKKYSPVWKSSNTKVAKVDKNGKITAGKTTGKATITYTVAGQTKSCEVYVYKFTGLAFGDNSKSSLTEVWGNPTTTFNTSFSKTITIKQSNKTASAYDIMTANGLAKPKVTSSNKKVAEAVISAQNINNPSGNDTITLSIKPKKIGTTKITVKFGGKTATYNLTVKYQMQSSWLDYSKIVNQTYSGKAYKPKVTKTKATNVTVPKDFKYKVSYKNNKNAGTATVTIKGDGNYTGTITKTFTIAPKNLTACTFSSSTKSKSYNGKAQKVSTTVKDGKKTTLKAGASKDYEVQYYYNRTWTATAPTNVGTYSVRIVGKNNYTGIVPAPNTYEIKQIKLSKVTISCAKEVKWKKGKAVTPPVKVKIGKNTLAAGPDYTVGYYKITKNSSGQEVRTAVASTALCDKGNYVAVITKTENSNNIDWGTKLTVEKKFKIKKMS